MANEDLNLPPNEEENNAPPKSPRQLAMEDIAEKRAKEVEGDKQLAIQQGLTEIVEVEAEPIASDVMGFTKDEEGNSFLSLKVDGNEVRLTPDEVKQKLQKIEAAEVRLRDASEKQRQADEILKNAIAKSAIESQPSPPDVADEEFKTKVHTAVKGFREQLVDGDPDVGVEEFTENLTDLLNSRRANSSTEAEIRYVDGLVERKLLEREDKNNLSSAIASFETNYPAFANSTVLRDMVNAATVDVQQDPTFASPNDYNAVFDEAVVRVKKDLGSVGVTDVDPIAEAEELKRAATRSGIQQAANASRVVSPLKPAPPATKQSIVAKMKEGRGQVI